jgi:GAF domain-containing protein
MQDNSLVPTQYIAAIVVAVPGILLIAWIAYWLGGLRARKIANEITNLNEIGRQLLRSQLSVEGLCELLYWHAGQIVPAKLFQLGLFDDTTYMVKVWVRDSERIPGTVFPGGGSKGIIGWVRETGKPLLIHDFEAERETLPAFPEQEQDSPPRSGLFVPLIAGNATIGVMAVQSRQANRFTEEHVRLLTALANQAAWAVRNAQLYEHANLRAEQLRLIGEIGAQISSAQPLNDLFRQTVSLIQQSFGYYCVNIFTLEEETLCIAATTSRAFEGLEPSIKVGEGMIGWAAEHCTYALANNVEDDLRYRKLGVLPETQSEIALPFQIEDRILGILDVQSDKKGAFQNDDVFVLETLAAQVSLAIDQAQNYVEQRELAQRLEILAQVMQAVVSILDLSDLLDEVVDLVSENFGFERVHIFLRSGTTLIFRAGAGPHSVQWQVDNLTYDLDDDGLIPLVARTGEAVSVGDVRKSPDYRAGPGLEDTISELALPIKMGANILGVIDLQSDTMDAFSE